MAGMGESCSHIGAIRNHVTEEKANWLTPTFKNAEYKQVKDINYSAAKTIYKKLHSNAAGEKTEVISHKLRSYASPNNDEINNVLRKLVMQKANQQFYQ